MAGHSKWANIKHRKGRQDEKKQKIFSKLIRELTVASKLGGSEVADNPRLRLALDKALGANMPKDTIERAIKKGLGGEGANLTEITFEGYASNGIAVFVEATTDNNNRTVASVRSIFNFEKALKDKIRGSSSENSLESEAYFSLSDTISGWLKREETSSYLSRNESSFFCSDSDNSTAIPL